MEGIQRDIGFLLAETHRTRRGVEVLSAHMESRIEHQMENTSQDHKLIMEALDAMKDISRDVAILKEDVRTLSKEKSVIRRLRKDYERLETENERLKAENERLKAENERLNNNNFKDEMKFVAAAVIGVSLLLTTLYL